MPARRYLIRGRVQGVGFRHFTMRNASKLGLSGWVRNLDDGRVEAFAMGPTDVLSSFEGLLYKGPTLSQVRSVDVEEAAESKLSGFSIR